jgi:phenylpropionate dioxygenase-like ring-hydroxylating dioxygenase large terminal subunit
MMQVHTTNKACVAVYPSTVHHDIVWFWPNSDPQYKDIITKKQPPTIPELDDPSFIKLTGCRDIPYGYANLRCSSFFFQNYNFPFGLM